MAARWWQKSVLGATAATLVLLLSFLVVLPEGAQGATTRTLVISNATSSSQVPYQTFDGNPPKLFDINGDGRLEIIAQNDNQWVYVFDSATGALLFEARTKFPAGWGARSFNGPEVSVLSQDGTVRLIVANSAAMITSFRFDHVSAASNKFVFVQEWERRLNDCYSNPGMDSKPVLADLDKDGRFEILGATEEFGLYALRSDGQLYWKNCLGGGNAEPGIADLNLDGWPDVVHVSDGGVVAALNGRTGGWMWGYSILNHFPLGSASIPVGPGLGQLDGRGGPDIVVGVRDSHDAKNFSKNHAMLLALDGGGRLLWANQDPTGNPLTYTHPIVVDADGDGANEVYWGDWNTMGHKPPFNDAEAWAVTGPAHFYRYSADGDLVWRQTLDTYWSNKDLALADVDDDGVQEVLANGPGPGGDGIWYLDSRTGAKETFVSAHPWKVARGPVVGDLWATGTMQWVIPGGPADNTVSGGALLVYDTRAPYDAAYPHLPYPSLGAPPAQPTGCFAASFSIGAANEWWQEVYVAPSPARTIAAVDVRMDGGPWEAMSKASWGAWTSSHRAVAGTRVEFLAHDPANQVAQSLPFTWLNGETSKASVPCTSTSPTSTAPTGTTSSPPVSSSTVATSSSPPASSSTPATTGTPGSGTFSASYVVSPNVNAWWVEVSVEAATSVQAVHARADGGPWVALAKQGWGTWAKSFYVPACSQVEFRATATDGRQNTSAPVTWLSSGACSSSTPFAVTFSPKAVGNDWWIEVDAAGNRPISTVAASVNGGAWTPLARQAWGSWAKSTFVADGSQVVFQATATTGETVQSPATTWT